MPHYFASDGKYLIAFESEKDVTDLIEDTDGAYHRVSYRSIEGMKLRTKRYKAVYDACINDPGTIHVLR